MALSIKSEVVERLARELAKETGESVTVAVRVALEERLRRHRGGGSLRAELETIGKRCSRLPILDPRRPDQILGYDEPMAPR